MSQPRAGRNTQWRSTQRAGQNIISNKCSFSTLGELSVNRIDLLALTSAEPTLHKLLLKPLDVHHLINRLYMLLCSIYFIPLNSQIKKKYFVFIEMSINFIKNLKDNFMATARCELGPPECQAGMETTIPWQPKRE